MSMMTATLLTVVIFVRRTRCPLLSVLLASDVTESLRKAREHVPMKSGTSGMEMQCPSGPWNKRHDTAGGAVYSNHKAI